MDMRHQKLRLSICSMVGSAVVAFNALTGCQPAKIDYCTETEWTYINETDAVVEIHSDNGVYQVVLQPSQKENLSVGLPVNPKDLSVTAQMSPFFDGATVIIDGESYRLPGFLQGKDVSLLPSICNALKYRLETVDNAFLFSFVLDETFLKEVQSY